MFFTGSHCNARTNILMTRRLVIQYVPTHIKEDGLMILSIVSQKC